MLMNTVPPPTPDVIPQPEPRPQPPQQPPEIIEPPEPDTHQPVGDPLPPGVGIVRQCVGPLADPQPPRRLLS